MLTRQQPDINPEDARQGQDSNARQQPQDARQGQDNNASHVQNGNPKMQGKAKKTTPKTQDKPKTATQDMSKTATPRCKTRPRHQPPRPRQDKVKTQNIK